MIGLCERGDICGDAVTELGGVGAVRVGNNLFNIIIIIIIIIKTTESEREIECVCKGSRAYM